MYVLRDTHPEYESKQFSSRHHYFVKLSVCVISKYSSSCSSIPFLLKVTRVSTKPLHHGWCDSNRISIRSPLFMTSMMRSTFSVFFSNHSWLQFIMPELAPSTYTSAPFQPCVEIFDRS